ncbi:MAG: C_GCAxxG_C_C family protein [Lachnospiraceae bacterium]|nr:C_GCAxxG_C_C family protein [Lachnospiraceae bacterium]
METRQEKAVRLFKDGFNCSQAVFAAFADKYGMDEETALKLSSSFGGGMGRMREVCGAVSGMFMVAGLETGSANPGDKEGKAYNYQVVRELADEFKKENGSIICRELLGLDKNIDEKSKKELVESHRPQERTDEYYKKRPCVELVAQAVEILEKRF